jgi:hypothetical protein
MSRSECAREPQVVQAVLSGLWPEQVDSELTAHASACEICGEVATVATLLRHDNEQARRDVQVPAAGQVWWRAAVRARLETAQAATRPMTWLHGITAACMAGVTLAAISMAWPSILSGSAWVRAQLLAWLPGGEALGSAAPGSAALGDGVAGVVTMALGQSVVLGLVAAACLVLAPVVLYFALSDE